MMTLLTVITWFLLSSVALTDAAAQCYACNPCGTTWNPSAVTVIQTSNLNDYCRKTVSGSLVVKDSSPFCTPINLPNNGVYCCQTDFCNSANKSSITLITFILCRLIYEIFISQ